MDHGGPPFKRSRADEFFMNGHGHSQPFPAPLYGADPFAERELLSTGLGSKSKAYDEFFSVPGFYSEGSHYSHMVPGGVPGFSGAQNPMMGKPMRGTMPPGGPAVLKTKICNKFETAEGCRFGDKCHFAHGEHELARNNPAPPSLPERGNEFPSFLGRPGFSEPTPPGIAAAASFGASSTAKVSIDAAMAGAVIGKNGVNVKQICRQSGARLIIKDHESDPTKKNVEMEGSFDQIKMASEMVRELLYHTDAVPSKPTSAAPHAPPPQNYKSKLCEFFPKGKCTFGDQCHFAHGPSELRKTVV